jgi:PAS domain S-box-containing protein
MKQRRAKRRPTHRAATAKHPIAPPLSADNFFAGLMDQIAEGIALMSERGIVVYVNKAAANMVGVPKERIIGRHFGEFVDPSSKNEAAQYFVQALAGKTIRQGTVKIIARAKGAVPIEFSASAFRGMDGHLQVHSIFRDISERMEMESIIREREKAGAVQYFIAGATQEIRNPLLALAQHMEKLIAAYAKRDFEYIGYKEYKEIFESLSAMQKRAKYCYDTTERLLNIGKQRIGVHERHCDVNEAVKSALNKIRPSAEIAGIALRAQLAQNIPQANISHIELSEVMVNLLTNAVQSITTHNGSIVVKTGKAKGKQAVFIECSDNGIGISTEDIGRVFEPFFTTKHRGLEKNSGLGLSIVHSIVKSHKGEIDLKSNLREGTRIRLTFPAKN